jgi:hypothetical protein
MEDNPATTADQDAWVAIAEQVRTRLAESIPLIPTMKVEEQKQFVETLRDAYWLHQCAVQFDKKVELELARVSPE